MKRTVAIVQARMSSTRLPGKALMDLAGKPTIARLMHRLGHARSVDPIMLAIPDGPADDELALLADRSGWICFRGSEADVLGRYYEAATVLGLKRGDAVVRVTGDDAMVDPRLVDALVKLFWACHPAVHHVSNNRVPTFPYGSDVEVFSFQALQEAWREAMSPEDREHVTPFLRRNPDRYPFVEARLSMNLTRLHYSIDTYEDIEFNRGVFSHFDEMAEPEFSWWDVARYVDGQQS